MCRLFGMHAGTQSVKATFWLLTAPDSLSEQSHREPDGAGIGIFNAQGVPVVSKQPIGASEDRLFAHNGALEGLDRLDARLEELHAASLVLGRTDSERMFALITAETRRRNGDLPAGIRVALTWITANLPVYSLNLVITTATDPGWRLMEPGELLHVDARLSVSSSTPLPAVPCHPLTLADLDRVTATSQHPHTRAVR